MLPELTNLVKGATGEKGNRGKCFQSLQEHKIKNNPGAWLKIAPEAKGGHKGTLKGLVRPL
jgi:hypothetical protein